MMGSRENFSNLSVPLDGANKNRSRVLVILILYFLIFLTSCGNAKICKEEWENKIHGDENKFYNYIYLSITNKNIPRYDHLYEILHTEISNIEKYEDKIRYFEYNKNYCYKNLNVNNEIIYNDKIYIYNVLYKKVNSLDKGVENDNNIKSITMCLSWVADVIRVDNSGFIFQDVTDRIDFLRLSKCPDYSIFISMYFVHYKDGSMRIM